MRKRETKTGSGNSNFNNCSKSRATLVPLHLSTLCISSTSGIHPWIEIKHHHQTDLLGDVGLRLLIRGTIQHEGEVDLRLDSVLLIITLVLVLVLGRMVDRGIMDMVIVGDREMAMVEVVAAGEVVEGAAGMVGEMVVMGEKSGEVVEEVEDGEEMRGIQNGIE